MNIVRFALVRPAMTVRWLGLAVLWGMLVVQSEVRPACAQNWPQFRGPGGNGVADGATFPTQWAPGHNVAWSAPVPGIGRSSPTVWGDRVFVKTAIPDNETDEPPKGMRPESKVFAPPDSNYDWRVLCFGLADGKLLWQTSVKTGRPERGKHIKSSYASETPATDGQHVYAYFWQAGLYALDFTGQIVWQQQPPTEGTYGEYGTASSPITDGQRVYLQCDYLRNSFLAAYDCRDGNLLWRAQREPKNSWSTPCLWKNRVRTELVAVGPERAVAYDPSDGRTLWELGKLSGLTGTTAVTDDELCYITSGWIPSKNRPVIAVRAGATGDVTPADDQSPGPHVAWRVGPTAPYVPSPVAYRGRLYLLGDGAIWNCLDLRTGESVYGRKRLPQGGPFTASPWACAGKLFCLTEGGLCYVLAAGDEFQVLSTNPPLDEDGLFLATPAVAGDALLIRGAQQLHCIRAD
ncbi:MAG: PQQ-like beta-propeller repeat protein [Pirellulales bacterium]|nr:PQQ-like beta-propeller repeat protein [Pirellulales bacterium]